ncbi:DUF6020 family protein [Limosilactobacillus reuteri]|uniref:DUF6020 family protein n=1 Tax=Limosilactobacillus reuteri TaxID=1598 RepID=UPI002B054759|nr:DUF6020 family protein [Limosilactobacillus reuteri]
MARSNFFKFLIIMTGISLLFDFQKINLNSMYLLVYIPIMIAVYLLLNIPLKTVFLNKNISYILSVILSLITIGNVCGKLGIQFELINVCKLIVIIVGFTILFEKTFQLLIQFSTEKNLITDEKGISWKKSFFIIVLGWVIYLLPFLPGNVAGDGNFQLIEYFGHAAMTNHHPFLSTMLEGGILNLGKHILNDNFGLFLYVIIQLLICCLIYSYCIFKVSTLGINKKIGIYFSIFIGFAPYWSFVSETLHKDGLFIAFFALFITSLVMMSVNLFIRKRLIKKQLILLTVSALLVCFWRNDGIYMVIPSIICLIFVNKRKYWKTFTCSLLVLLSVYVAFNKVLLPALDVAPTEKREMLSLPVQQTSRYIKYYPNEITKNQRQVLKETFNNSTKLGELYNPNNADPTKLNLKDQFNVKKYINIWIEMGLRHPFVYLAATFEGTNAYYTPWLLAQNFTWCGAISDWSKPNFLDLHYITPKKLRSSFIGFVNGVASLPFINMFLNDSLAIWLGILMAAFMWRKFGFKYLIPIIPIFMNLLICIASPVNGLIRYSGCVVFAIYILLTYYFYVLKFRN